MFGAVPRPDGSREWLPGEGPASRWAQGPVVQLVAFCRAGRYKGSPGLGGFERHRAIEPRPGPADVVEMYALKPPVLVRKLPVTIY